MLYASRKSRPSPANPAVSALTVFRYIVVVDRCDNMDPGPQAYGAGKVGGQFNIQNFVRKPHVFVRLLSLVRTIIILYNIIIIVSTCVYIYIYMRTRADAVRNTWRAIYIYTYVFILCEYTWRGHMGRLRWVVAGTDRRARGGRSIFHFRTRHLVRCVSRGTRA